MPSGGRASRPFSIAIIGAVRRDQGNVPLDASEQKRHLRCVVVTPVDQHVRGDLTGTGVDGEMQLAPAPSRPAVLDRIPFTLPEQLQTLLSNARWIGPGLGSTRGHRPAKRPSPPVERGMVRNRQIEPEQAQDAAGKRFDLAQGQVEPEAQRQHEFDRQVGVDRLSTWRASLGRRPARNSRLVQPQREVATSSHSVRSPRRLSPAS